ncbi:MAG TPA: glutathione S-transferase N-terminal domain-containing protein [Gaiellaceae bacterium]|nr:glutathione S-transferase N-terminal domain-containing protein [Gaiellaceae bacterium]
MAVKLHRCGNLWVKVSVHPCWKVQKALDEQGIEYEVVPGPWPSRKKRTTMIEHTGQPLYPAIEFEDGTWYREESKEMAQTIRDGKLREKQSGSV